MLVNIRNNFKKSKKKVIKKADAERRKRASAYLYKRRYIVYTIKLYKKFHC